MFLLYRADQNDAFESRKAETMPIEEDSSEVSDDATPQTIDSKETQSFTEDTNASHTPVNKVDSLSEETFENRATNWLPISNGSSSTPENFRKFYHKFKFIPDRFWVRLIDLKPGKALFLGLNTSSIFREQIFRPHKTETIIFQEGRYVSDMSAPEFRRDIMFCDLRLVVNENGDDQFSIKETDSSIFNIVKDVSVDRETYKGFVGVHINLLERKNALRSISSIRCYTPTNKIEDDSYKLMEIYHMLYSFKTSGSSLR